jgi:hypothetical protein
MRVKLLAIEGNLTRVMGPNPMFLSPKTLNIRLAALTSVVQAADEAPPKQSLRRVRGPVGARRDGAVAVQGGPRPGNSRLSEDERRGFRTSSLACS